MIILYAVVAMLIGAALLIIAGKKDLRQRNQHVTDAQMLIAYSQAAHRANVMAIRTSSEKTYELRAREGRHRKRRPV